MLHLASYVRGPNRIGGHSRAARTSPGRFRLIRATAHLARRRVQPRIATRETSLRLRRARRMSLMSQGGLYAGPALPADTSGYLAGPEDVPREWRRMSKIPGYGHVLGLVLSNVAVAQ